MARIQGITIEIDGDTTGLSKALKSVDNETKNVQKELKQIDGLLKFDSSNVELLTQKQKLLGDAVDSTSKRLDVLKQAQSQVEQQFKNGEIGEEAFRKFQREIIATEGKLKAFKQQAENVDIKLNAQTDTTGIEKMKTAMKELGPAAKQAASEIGSALSTAGAAGTAAVTGLVVGMADTNKDLAMLETQIGQVGLALEDIGNARTTFDSVGQQTDQVTEAMGNLIQAGYQTKDSIDDISSSLAGAIVKYGDTFNVEGLAESITTTTQLGEVTGQLTDLLEKEGINVENFNAKIQSMSTEQERANYISQLLADQGLTSLYNKYADGNAEIVNASSAQVSMTDALSQLSIALTPLVTTVSEFVTKIVEWANENQGLATVLAVVIGAVTALSGVFALFGPIITFFIQNWGALKLALSAVGGPIGIAIAAITALVAAGIALWKNWDEVSSFLSGVWENIKSVASTVFIAIGDVFKTVWEGIKSTTETVWNGIKSFFSTIWDGIKSVFDTVLGVIESSLKKYWDSMGDGIKTIWDGIKQYFSGVWDLIKNVFVGALVVVLQLLTGKWGEAKKSTEQIWKNIQDALKNVWEGLKKVFSGALEAVLGYIKTTWDNIKSTTSSVFEAVKSTISSVWQGIKGTVSSVSENILSTVKSAFTSLVSSVSDKMIEVKSTIEKWWSQALSYLKGINLTQIGKDIIQGLINGIKNMTSSAIEAITGVVDGIVDKAKSLLKIKSPSRVMRQIGEWTGEGLAVGIEKSVADVEKATEKMVGKVIKTFDDLPETVNGFAKSVFKDFNSVEAELQSLYMTGDKYGVSILKLLNTAKNLGTLNWYDQGKVEQLLLKETELAGYRLTEMTQEREQEIQRIESESAAKRLEIVSAYENEVQKRTGEILKQYSLLEKVELKDVDASEFSESLESQINSLELYNESVAKLAERNLSTELLGEIVGLGPKMASEVAAFADMSEEELNRYVELWDKKNSLARATAEAELTAMRLEMEQQLKQIDEETKQKLDDYNSNFLYMYEALNDTTSTEMDNLRSDLVKDGANAIKGLQQGMESQRASIVNTASSIANAISSTIQGALDINSPSRVMRGFGVNIGEGLTLGMDDMISKVAETSQRLSDAASNALGSLASSSVKSQSLGSVSTSSSSVDNSRHFAPSIVINTQDSGSNAMDRTLRRLALKFN